MRDADEIIQRTIGKGHVESRGGLGNCDARVLGAEGTQTRECKQTLGIRLSRAG